MHITNHAIIRFAERYLGFEFEENSSDSQKLESLEQAGVVEIIKTKILTPYIKSQIKAFKPKTKSRFYDKNGGYSVIIEHGINVVTVI